MKIRNPVLLKRPWLFSVFTLPIPACAIVGGGLNDPKYADLRTFTLTIIAGVVLVVNVLFYIILRDQRNQP